MPGTKRENENAVHEEETDFKKVCFLAFIICCYFSQAGTIKKNQKSMTCQGHKIKFFNIVAIFLEGKVIYSKYSKQ